MVKVSYHLPPPNFEAVRARFPLANRRGVYFCFGDTVYVPWPSGRELDAGNLVHEGVHSERQGADPFGWWDRYLTDREFRLEEERLAYRAELLFRGQPPCSRPLRRQWVKRISHMLASPLYDLGITVARAKELLAVD